jgi:hypothetical protein
MQLCDSSLTASSAATARGPTNLPARPQRPTPKCRRNAASHAIVAVTLRDWSARSRRANATHRWTDPACWIEEEPGHSLDRPAQGKLCVAIVAVVVDD